VGKSTLIKSLKPDLTINLASEEEYFLFQSQLSELEYRLEASKPKTIFIDEIQRIPRLLNSIQAILDDDPKVKFYLTGSSARKLKRGRANLLPGRIYSFELAPLTFEELGDDWNETKALQYGSLPGVVTAPTELDKKRLLLNYSNSYLKEEILAESLVRGVEGFVRFLQEAAISSGGFLDYSKLSQKAKIPRQSVVRHFEILEDTLIAKKIQNDPDLDENKFDLVKHPRFFFFDLGVCNALRGSFEISGDRIGPLWEYLVFNQVCHSAKSKEIDFNLFNFRTRGGLEVDFIAHHEGKKFAIECKATTHLNDSDLKGLLQIARYYRNIDKILIYRGKIERKIQGIWALPLGKALKHLGLN
jgi:predicted AAA+ superfamily ATPase